MRALIIKLVGWYTAFCVWLYRLGRYFTMVTAAIRVRNDVPLLYCYAGRHNVTEFVKSWYRYDSTHTISSLYTFLEAGTKSGFVSPDVIKGTIVFVHRSDSTIYKSVYDFSGEEKEMTTNTEGDSLMLGKMPGTSLMTL